jgi:Tfp pilus assembly protein PilX
MQLRRDRRNKVMRTPLKRNHPEAGVALIIALLTLLILAVLAASIIFVTQTETWASSNSRSMVQARYAAEAGAQKALYWLHYTYAPPANMAAFDTTKYPIQLAGGGDVILSAMMGVNGTYPDAAQQAAFGAVLTDASVPGLGVPASYEVTAKLLSSTSGGTVSWLGGGGGGAIQTWQITSQGNVPGVRNAQVQVVMNIERTGTPIFNYAVAALGAGCKSIDFGGSDFTDSYNSSAGSYGVGNSSASGGSIATNGNVYLGSGANIEGTISVPNTAVGACPDGITSSGGYSGASKLSSPLTTSCSLGAPNCYPLPWGCSALPCYPSPLPTTASQSLPDNSSKSAPSCGGMAGCTTAGTTNIYINGSSTATTVSVYNLQPTVAADGTSGPTYGNLSIGGNAVVHLSAGTYDINSLNLPNDAQIVIDSGPVVMNVAGQGYGAGQVVVNSGGLSGLNDCSLGVVANVGDYTHTTCGSSKTAISGVPAELQIVYAGQGTISATGAPIVSAIYAPNAYVNTVGGAVGMYGSIVCSTFLEGSKAPVHYDKALQNLMVPGPYYPISFTWSKF